MATASHTNPEFWKGMLGSELTKVSWVQDWGRFKASPNTETLVTSSPSIQLSLGGLLSSRAHLCFTGQVESTGLGRRVNGARASSGLKTTIPGRLFHLRQRITNYFIPRRLFSLRQQAESSRIRPGD